MPEKEKKDIELRSEEFHEVLGSVPPWILRWGITILAIIVIVILIGSSIFKYPDIISSTMTLTGTTPSVAVITKTSGKFQSFDVKDNQIVKSGDYLAIIENPAKTKDILYLKSFLLSLNHNSDSILVLPPKDLSLGNIQSLYSSFYIILFNYMEFKRLGYYPKKGTIIKDRINKYEIQYNNLYRQKDIVVKQFFVTKKQYSRDSLLHKRGVLSDEDFENSYTKYLQGTLSVENMYTTIENLEIQINQIRESLVDIEQQYIENKNSLETQLKTSLSQLLTEIQTWEMDYVLIAPIDGQVTFTNYWAENQNVISGEVAFNIIPKKKSGLLGKAILPMARSGKVKIGQSVNIRFENFPDNEFGIVKGIVQNISLVPSVNNKENSYVVEIRLNNGLKTTYNKELPYLPEMQAQADIVTDDLSLLERFFMPLRKIWKESME